MSSFLLTNCPHFDLTKTPWLPTSMAQNAPLEQLASQLYAAAKEITAYCEQQNHPQKSFDRIEPVALLPADAPQGILAAQQKINEASTSIQQLVVDPNDFLGRFQVQVGRDMGHLMPRSCTTTAWIVHC